jgi:NADH:ubiquinone oxidoreductase subunit H
VDGVTVEPITLSNIPTIVVMYGQDLAMSRRYSSMLSIRSLLKDISNEVAVGAKVLSMLRANAVEMHVWL